MTVEHIILALVVMLGLSLIAQPFARLLHMPIASILVLLGYVTSELIVFNGVDTGLRADNFQFIIFYILIPVLVFESAINIDKTKLKKNFVVILLSQPASQSYRILLTPLTYIHVGKTMHISARL